MDTELELYKFAMGIAELVTDQPDDRFSGMNCLDACKQLISETDQEGIPPNWHDLLSQHGDFLAKAIVP